MNLSSDDAAIARSSLRTMDGASLEVKARAVRTLIDNLAQPRNIYADAHREVLTTLVRDDYLRDEALLHASTSQHHAQTIAEIARTCDEKDLDRMAALAAAADYYATGDEGRAIETLRYSAEQREPLAAKLRANIADHMGGPALRSGLEGRLILTRLEDRVKLTPSQQQNKASDRLQKLHENHERAAEQLRMREGSRSTDPLERLQRRGPATDRG